MISLTSLLNIVLIKALTMLLHIDSQTRGGKKWRPAWGELKKILRFSIESNDEIYGAMIKRTVCKFILSMLRDGVTLDILFIRELLSIAWWLKTEDSFEKQLKYQITSIMIKVMQNREQLGPLTKGTKHFLEDVMRYLKAVGVVQMPPV